MFQKKKKNLPKFQRNPLTRKRQQQRPPESAKERRRARHLASDAQASAGGLWGRPPSRPLLAFASLPPLPSPARTLPASPAYQHLRRSYLRRYRSVFGRQRGREAARLAVRKMAVGAGCGRRPEACARRRPGAGSPEGLAGGTVLAG